jgi:hypothetical protein
MTDRNFNNTMYGPGDIIHFKNGETYELTIPKFIGDSKSTAFHMGDHIDVSQISHITREIQTDAQKKEEEHKALGKQLALEAEKRDKELIASHKTRQELDKVKVQQDMDFFKLMLKETNPENFHGHDMYCEIERLNMEIREGNEKNDYLEEIAQLTKQRDEHQQAIKTQGLKQQTCLRPQLQRLVGQLRKQTNDIDLKKSTNKQLVTFIQNQDMVTIEKAMENLLSNWDERQ